MNKSHLKLLLIPATVLFCLIMAFSLSPVISHADEGDSPSEGTFTLKNPLSEKYDSVGGLVQAFIEIFSYIAILFAVLALIYVGLRFILARGDPTKMNELKSWLMWIVVGVAVVIGARIIIQVVISTLDASGVVDQRTIQSAQKAVKGK